MDYSRSCKGTAYSRNCRGKDIPEVFIQKDLKWKDLGMITRNAEDVQKQTTINSRHSEFKSNSRHSTDNTCCNECGTTDSLAKNNYHEQLQHVSDNLMKLAMDTALYNMGLSPEVKAVINIVNDYFGLRK